MQDAQHGLGIHRDRHAFGPLAVLAGTIEHRRDLAARAQPIRLVLAPTFSLHRFECRVHVAYPYTNNEETDVSS